jgi:hypothetical protein
VKYHLSLSVEGTLRQSDKDLKGLFQFDDGRTMTPHQARQQLRIEQMKGRRVIPMTACDNFCYQKGCLGHEE